MGIDFGTSGVRAAIVDANRGLQFQHKQPYPAVHTTLPDCWHQALIGLLAQVPPQLRAALRTITCDGTSATVLLCDSSGQPLTAPLMYNDDRGQAALITRAAAMPEHHPAVSATSSLAKLLWWQQTLPATTWSQATYILHQADWLLYLLHGLPGLSDYHNSLKLGFDPVTLTYPDWLQSLGIFHLLPEVRAPGSIIAPIRIDLARQFGLSPQCQICAGTTDSNAAFLASGASQPGDGVTTLGSTLVVKQLSPDPITDGRYGIYSHRVGSLWLAGGASNTGGAVLKHYFSDMDLATLSQQIDLTQPCLLNYYPLLVPGERFPINDPSLVPQLSPRPTLDRDFLYGLLTGIARIERQSYDRLQQLGTPPLKRIFTSGGGAQNLIWTMIRRREIGQPIELAHHTEAAVGTAYLAAGILRT